MKTRLLFVGDAHAGLKVGLWPPGYRPDPDEGAYALGKAQKVIWRQLQAAKKWMQQGQDQVLVLMGDLVHGPEFTYPDMMVTADTKSQCQAFIEAILPLAAKTSAIYVVDDLSQHHVDAGRFANDYIAGELGAWGKRAYGKLDLHIQDLHLQLKHHGPAIGSRPHTEGNVVRAYMRDMHIEALERGDDTADIFVFAHWHRYWRELLQLQKGERTVYAYYTPALCSADKRTIRNVKRLVLSNIGTLGMEIEGDWHTVTKMFEAFDSRVKVVHAAS